MHRSICRGGNRGRVGVCVDLPASSSCRNGLPPPMALSISLLRAFSSSCAASSSCGWPVEGWGVKLEAEAWRSCPFSERDDAARWASHHGAFTHTLITPPLTIRQTHTQACPTPSSYAWLASPAMQWSLRRGRNACSSGCFTTSSGLSEAGPFLCTIFTAPPLYPRCTHPHKHRRT